MSFLKFLVGVTDYLENPMPYEAQVVSPAVQTLTFVSIVIFSDNLITHFAAVGTVIANKYIQYIVAHNDTI